MVAAYTASFSTILICAIQDKKRHEQA